ncbi:MAG: hypothetical protein JWO09_847 [Bacteroidetes bacterium]|nr:hypothetical protein [Bacteroidota bacterium]
MKRFLPFFLFLLAFSSLAQDTSKILRPEARYRHSLGGRKWGIGLGNNPPIYSGLKFNFRNENSITNGINLTCISSSDHNYPCSTNGINISLLFLEQKVLNGIGITPFWISVDNKMNGIFATGFISDTDTLNGIGLTGLVHLSGNVINGISVAGLDVTSDNINGIGIGGIVCIADDTHNGISIGGIFSGAETMNGIMAALVTKSQCTRGIQLGLVNTCTFMQGMQLGLINVIRENPRWCRVMPFINFHIRKFVPRIDTVTDGNYLVVTRYQLDNRTLRAVETWDKQLFDSIKPFDTKKAFYHKQKPTEKFQLHQTGPCNGREASYDERGRLLQEVMYAADTLQSKRSISYTPYNEQRISYLHDSVTETWITKNEDTLEYTRTVGGIQVSKKTKQEDYMNEVYDYMVIEKGKTNDYRVYNGENIIEKHKELGELRLLKGDTLQDEPAFFWNFTVGEDLWTEDIEPCFKDNIAFYTNGKGRLKGLGYISKDSSVFKKIIYYNYRKGKVRRRALYTKTAKIDTSYYRSGKISVFENDSTVIRFNRRGKVIRQDVYEGGHYKTFKKGKLTYSSSEDCFRSFYRNGKLKREHNRWGNNTYSKQCFRRNGSLKKEESEEFPVRIKRYYRKNGSLKRQKRYEHNKLVLITPSR